MTLDPRGAAAEAAPSSEHHCRSRRSGGCYSEQPETLTSCTVVTGYTSTLSPLYCCSYVFIRQIWQQCGACHWPKKEGAFWLACLYFPFFSFLNCVHLSSLLQISSVKNVKGVPGKAKIDAVHRLKKRNFIDFLHNNRCCSVHAVVVIEAKAVMTTQFQELHVKEFVIIILFSTFQRCV